MSEKRKRRPFLLFEEIVAFVSTILIIFVPFFDTIILKLFPKTGGIPGSDNFVKYSVIALCFSASILTTKDRKHLSVGILEQYSKGAVKGIVETFNAFVSAAITFLFATSSLVFVFTAVGTQSRIGVFPEWILVMIMPLAYLIMSVYFIRFSGLGIKGQLVASLGFLLGAFLSFPALGEFFMGTGREVPAWIASAGTWFTAVYPWFNAVWVIVLIVGALTGVPIFVVLGGLAYTFFTKDQNPISAIPIEPMSMLRKDMIPALPLFTITGYILSESKAGKRLIDVFKSLMGWMPGGTLIVAVLVCTFFTTFTGASGVTILALGGLLAIILKDSGYNEDFTTGIITSSGAIGVMLPPSLAVIMYGVYANLDIKQAFLANLLPGLLMVIAMCIMGIFFSVRTKAPITPFKIGYVGKSLLEAIWELLLPLGIVLAYFLGWATMAEASAFSVVYVIVIEVMVKREIKWTNLPGIILKSLGIVGGTLIILAAAQGLAEYIIFANVPDAITSWVTAWVPNKFVFLIVLNILLLIVGCFLDIFSATLVVAPLLLPIALHFGVNPIHFSAIFLVNLSIGFLTPPVGMNLFLGSYTFNQPLTRVYKQIVPFLLVQFVVLGIVTYVPWLSTCLISKEAMDTVMAGSILP